MVALGGAKLLSGVQCPGPQQDHRSGCSCAVLFAEHHHYFSRLLKQLAGGGGIVNCRKIIQVLYINNKSNITALNSN